MFRLKRAQPFSACFRDDVSTTNHPIRPVVNKALPDSAIENATDTHLLSRKMSFIQSKLVKKWKTQRRTLLSKLGPDNPNRISNRIILTRKSELRDLAATSRRKSIEAISLEGRELDDTDLELLKDAFPNLKKLRIDGCFRITDAGLAHLHSLSLAKLELHSSYISDEGVIPLLHGPLRYLNLEACTNVSGQVFEQLKPLNIEYLNLADTNIGTITPDIVRAIVNMRSLRHFDIRGSYANCSISAFDVLRAQLDDQLFSDRERGMVGGFHREPYAEELMKRLFDEGRMRHDSSRLWAESSFPENKKPPVEKSNNNNNTLARWRKKFANAFLRHGAPSEMTPKSKPDETHVIRSRDELPGLAEVKRRKSTREILSAALTKRRKKFANAFPRVHSAASQMTLRSKPEETRIISSRDALLDLAEAKERESIREITLDYSELSDTDLMIVQETLPRLQQLTIKGNEEITDTGLALLRDLPLEKLELDTCGVSAAGVAQLLRFLKKPLKHLSLAGCSGISGTLFTELKDSEIEHLNLVHTRIGIFTNDIVTDVVNMSRLKHLDIRNSYTVCDASAFHVLRAQLGDGLHTNGIPDIGNGDLKPYAKLLTKRLLMEGRIAHAPSLVWAKSKFPGLVKNDRSLGSEVASSVTTLGKKLGNELVKQISSDVMTSETVQRSGEMLHAVTGAVTKQFIDGAKANNPLLSTIIPTPKSSNSSPRPEKKRGKADKRR